MLAPLIIHVIQTHSGHTMMSMMSNVKEFSDFGFQSEKVKEREATLKRDMETEVPAHRWAAYQTMPLHDALGHDLCLGSTTFLRSLSGSFWHPSPASYFIYLLFSWSVFLLLFSLLL